MIYGLVARNTTPVGFWNPKKHVDEKKKKWAPIIAMWGCFISGALLFFLFRLETQRKPTTEPHFHTNPYESYSNPGTKTVCAKPCKELTRRLQICMVQILPSQPSSTRVLLVAIDLVPRDRSAGWACPAVTGTAS